MSSAVYYRSTYQSRSSRGMWVVVLERFAAWEAIERPRHGDAERCRLKEVRVLTVRA